MYHCLEPRDDMHRCGSSNHMMGPGSCSCGAYHHPQSSPLSVLFPDPYSNYPGAYPYSSSPSAYSSGASSVDCTLSLGTPSTRLSEDADDGSRRARGTNGHERRSSISNFCWDILGQSNKHAPPSSTGSNKSAGRSGGGDPLLARRCANCDTTSTPLWRNGPRGPKSLCNACGIRFKKEERRATAAAATASTDTQPMFSHGQYGSWATAASAQSHHQKLPCFGTEFRFIEDEGRDHPDNGISFLSWRLNVTDRPSGLIHDFTR